MRNAQKTELIKANKQINRNITVWRIVGHQVNWESSI